MDGVLSAIGIADRLTAQNYVCRCCGKSWSPQFGSPDPEAPFHWTGPTCPAPAKAIHANTDVLTDLYCKCSGDFLVRAYLPLELKENGKFVFLSVWCSLSEANFTRFIRAQNNGAAASLGDMFSYLFSEVPVGAPLLKRGRLVPYDNGALPLFWLEDDEHPLDKVQKKQISADDVVKLYRDLKAEVIDHLLA